ncbi:MAG: bifunctional phosphoribosylaminoimidazolecarboxamide formyltransferase/IMP cyclohydrolase [Limnochordaceae bacterium]|nr:bifunctional phosphoribosylaminoimidazolecarboxamide formyltransferase/IMP cyclohydrolase [Limnochordaceae bacterium]
MSTETGTIRRALISVWDKQGVVELARELVAGGVEILSTGGTQKALQEAGLPVTSVSEVTGFPEVLGGRVKTLHPRIHAAILARRDVPSDMQTLAQEQITPIDLVVVNLYPFAQTVARPGVTWEEAIEQIDIGGPSMLRAAAKNYAWVTVLCSPAQYPEFLALWREQQTVPLEQRRRWAAEVFAQTAAYDAAIQRFFLRELAPAQPPAHLTLPLQLVASLRYGENPHQKAAFYADPLVTAAAPAGPGGQGRKADAGGTPRVTLVNARQLHGKELSFNNIQDADAALAAVSEFFAPAAVAVKHMNPCGMAVGDSISEAYRLAYEGDPVSIFGGIVALNRPVDRATAELLHKTFLEVVLAPSFLPEAFEILAKKKNVRLLEVPGLFPDSQGGETRDSQVAGQGQESADSWAFLGRPELDLRKVSGGYLVQELDRIDLDTSAWKLVTKTPVPPELWEDLKFAWIAVKHVKSNAITVARRCQLLGSGAGQMNRITAARLALEQAGERARGAVLASDAFFPFGDVVEAAAAAGIVAIVQPGGSIRDEESIAACDRAGIAMVFTGRRHFRH